MSFNGYSNYATWRVNLELFQNAKGDWDADSCKEYVMQTIIHDRTKALEYANAFVHQVDYKEIAKHINEE